MIRLLTAVLLFASFNAVAEVTLTPLNNNTPADADDVMGNFNALNEALPPSNCSIDQIIKWNGFAWECRNDGVSILFGQSCPEGEMLSGFDATGGLICSGSVTSDSYFCENAAWEQMGSDILGEVESINDGAWSVGMSDSGLRVAIGARYNDSGGTYSGEARVFSWNGSDWEKLGGDISGLANQTLGWDVALDGAGDTLIVGAPCERGGCTGGYVRVFDFVDGDWQQRGGDINAIGYGDREGWAVDISRDGNRVLALAERGDGDGLTDPSRVRVFDWDGVQWQQVGGSIFGPVNYSYPRIARLAKDGNTLVVSWNSADIEYVNSGRVAAYTLVSGEWIQKGQDIDGSSIGEYAGVGDAPSLLSNGSVLASAVVANNGEVGLQIFEYDAALVWVAKGDVISVLDTATTTAMSSETRIQGNVIGFTTTTGEASIWQWKEMSWQQVGSWVNLSAGALRDFGMSEDAKIFAVPDTTFNSRQGRTRVYRSVGC